MGAGRVYCEECMEDIPNEDVYWDEDRLYCKICGSEVEPPDGDIFDQIVDNRSSFIFRDDDPDAIRSAQGAGDEEDGEDDDKEEDEMEGGALEDDEEGGAAGGGPPQAMDGDEDMEEE